MTEENEMEEIPSSQKGKWVATATRLAYEKMAGKLDCNAISCDGNGILQPVWLKDVESGDFSAWEWFTEEERVFEISIDISDILSRLEKSGKYFPEQVEKYLSDFEGYKFRLKTELIPVAFCPLDIDDDESEFIEWTEEVLGDYPCAYQEYYGEWKQIEPYEEAHVNMKMKGYTFKKED